MAGKRPGPACPRTPAPGGWGRVRLIRGAATPGSGPGRPGPAVRRFHRRGGPEGIRPAHGRQGEDAQDAGRRQDQQRPAGEAAVMQAASEVRRLRTVQTRPRTQKTGTRASPVGAGVATPGMRMTGNRHQSVRVQVRSARFVRAGSGRRDNRVPMLSRAYAAFITPSRAPDLPAVRCRSGLVSGRAPRGPSAVLSFVRRDLRLCLAGCLHMRPRGPGQVAEMPL